MKSFKEYLSFSGKTTRKEFWIVVIASIILFIISTGLLMTVGIFLNIPAGPVFSIEFLMVALFVLLMFTITSQRLRDSNYSGWFVLLFFIPFIGWLLLLIVVLFPSVKTEAENKVQPNTKKTGKKTFMTLGIAWTIFIILIIVGGVIMGIKKQDNSNIDDIKKENINVTQNGNITNLETTGNLNVTHKLKCLSPQDIKSEYTPADLMPAVVDCINNKEYENGVVLFSVASLYGRFDMERVKDKTAHQAIPALIAKHLQFMDTPNKKEYNEFFKDVLNRLDNNKDKSPLKKRVCEGILNVPMPTYFPSYMIYHGMDAFDADFDVKKGVQKIDNPEKFWNGLLKERFPGCF